MDIFLFICMPIYKANTLHMKIGRVDSLDICLFLFAKYYIFFLSYRMNSKMLKKAFN